MADVRAVIKDAAYVTVGFGVLAVQQAQVRRQELRKRLGTGLGDAKGSFGRLGEDLQDRLKLVEERLEALGKQVDTTADDVEERFEKALDDVQERLPEQVKELFARARAAGKDARTQVRQLVKVNGTEDTTAA